MTSNLDTLERIFEVTTTQITPDTTTPSESSSISRVRTLLNRASREERSRLHSRLNILRSSPFRSPSSFFSSSSSSSSPSSVLLPSKYDENQDEDSVFQFGLYTFVEMIETLSSEGSSIDRVELLQDLVEFLARQGQQKHLIERNQNESSRTTSVVLDKTRNLLESLCEYEEATIGLVALAVLRESLHDLLVSVMTLLNSKATKVSSLNSFTKYLRPIANSRLHSTESSSLVTSDVFTCGQNAYVLARPSLSYSSRIVQKL